MKQYITLPIAILAFFCACTTQKIDENYARNFVKKTLSLPEPVTAKILTGGFSGASLFTVTANGKKYVVRFFPHKTQKDRQKEIWCLNSASKGGYGPRVYFTDVDQGVIIMEYLQHQKITREQRMSPKLYRDLAHLLQKIHQGPQFAETINIFDRIEEYIQKNKILAQEQQVGTIPLNKLLHILTAIRHACASHMTVAPCHNDLHPSNMIFLGNTIKVIDYETAAQSDPFFDVATVAIYNSFFNAKLEHTLFSTYLEREPTPEETAQLYLMKQAALISYAMSFLKMHPSMLYLYESLQTQPYEEFFNGVGKGKINLEDQDAKVALAKIMIDSAIANSETHEFKDALLLLNKNDIMNTSAIQTSTIQDPPHPEHSESSSHEDNLEEKYEIHNNRGIVPLSFSRLSRSSRAFSLPTLPLPPRESFI